MLTFVVYKDRMERVQKIDRQREIVRERERERERKVIL